MKFSIMKFYFEAMLLESLFLSTSATSSVVPLFSFVNVSSLVGINTVSRKWCGLHIYAGSRRGRRIKQQATSSRRGSSSSHRGGNKGIMVAEEDENSEPRSDERMTSKT